MSVAFLSPEESTEQRPGTQSLEEGGQIRAGCAGPRQRKRRALRAARGNWGSKRRKKAGWFVPAAGNLRGMTWEGTGTCSPGRMKGLEAPRGSCSQLALHFRGTFQSPA